MRGSRAAASRPSPRARAWIPVLGLVCALANVAPAAAAGGAEDGPVAAHRRVGRAYDRDSGELLYREVHRERRRGRRLLFDRVDYYDDRGRRIATKRIDYRRSQSVPDFVFEDLRTGRLERVRRVGKELEVSLRPRRGEDLSRARISLEDVDAVDEGFHHNVRMHFEELSRGGELDVALVYPHVQSEFTLRFDRGRTRTVSGRRLLQVKFRPASIFLRPFLDTCTLRYDTRTGQVVEYVGISNVRDEEGDPYSVRLVYEPTRRLPQTASAQSGAPPARSPG